MVKLIKISPLFFVAVIIVFICGYIYSFSIMFLSLMMHELIHLFFALKNKVTVSQITIEPFGISIAADNKNKITPIVYLSAPIFNIILGLVLYLLDFKNSYVNYFIIANLSLGIFNLIPSIPFDGGNALKILLTKKYGTEKSDKLANKTGFFVSVVLIVSGAYLVYITGFNFSVIIIGIFLFYNSITEKRLLVNKKLKHYTSLESRGDLSVSMQVINLAVPKNYPAHRLIKKFKPDNYYIIKIIDNGMIIKTLTETQIIKKIISTNKSLKVGDL